MKLVEIGPRPSGSEELETSRIYITDQLEKLGWSVQRQVFEKMTPEGKVEFVNLRSRFGAANWDGKVTGLLCSHYDTKKFSFRFVGANDAGSSTGLLIELAKVLAGRPELA
ncbi:MAG: M28 family peptidase, partial [Verrucomicrobiales bacterium]|nr:M28 family peptidase [Verrucomicrobiales bacterium]